MIDLSISNYHVSDRLGSGELGVVYKAEDHLLGRTVAIRILPESITQDPEALERLRQETRAASVLDHPNICILYDICREDERYFMVMEYVDGQTLRRRIEGRGLPYEVALGLALDIVDGLECAQEKGVIHGDINPANITVSQRGQAKILGFGLAGVLAKPAAMSDWESLCAESETGPKMTPTILAGKAAYLSPEQMRGSDIDIRTDLFSFGAVLYEMITGRRAFGGNTSQEIRTAILRGEPKPIDEITPGVPADFEALITKALAKDREHRYQHASQMRAELLRLQLESEQERRNAILIGAAEAAASMADRKQPRGHLRTLMGRLSL